MLRNKKTTIIIIFILIAPFTINLIFTLLKKIPITLNGSEETWISFLGGYIGAIITLGGVLLQIKEYRKQDLENEIKLRKKDETKLFQTAQSLYAVLIYEIRSVKRKFTMIKEEINKFDGSFDELKEYYFENFKKDKYFLKGIGINNFYEMLLKTDINQQNDLMHKYSTINDFLIESSNTLSVLGEVENIKTKKDVIEMLEFIVHKLKEIMEEVDRELKRYQNECNF